MAASPPASAGDAGLLLGYLRPERARVAGLSLVLLVAMLAPVAGPLLLGVAVDGAIAGEATGRLIAPAIAYLVVTLGADGCRVLVAWWAVHLAWEVGNRLRLDLARHALRLDLEWHGRHSPGQLIERLDGDIEAIVKFSSTAVLQLVGNVVLLAGVLVVAVVVDWRAGLLIGVAAGAAVAVMVRARTAAVPAHDATREVASALYGDLEERLGGLEDLRANGAGDYAVRRLHERSSNAWHAERRAAVIAGGSHAAAAGAFAVGSVLTLALGVVLHRNGQLSIGSTLALFRFSQMVRDPIERMAEQLREMQRAAAGARRAGRLLATEPTVADGRGVALPTGPLAVDLDGVQLVYATGRVALDGVHLHLRPGTRLGVVGRTGSGKTTLGRLLTRLWDPTAGTVRLGGVDLRDTTEGDLRRRVAVVSQDVELLDATLRDNLTLYGARPAGDGRLTAALVDVGLGPWLDALPAGLDARLDTRTLSGGEAQLLAFARVLLTDAGLVLLDEATSRLDPATETRLAAAAEQVLAGRTAVIVAHRLATLDGVDEICVVEDGRVVEQGARATLAGDDRSRYARLRAGSQAGSLVS